MESQDANRACHRQGRESASRSPLILCAARPCEKLSAVGGHCLRIGRDNTCLHHMCRCWQPEIEYWRQCRVEAECLDGARHQLSMLAHERRFPDRLRCSINCLRRGRGRERSVQPVDCTAFNVDATETVRCADFRSVREQGASLCCVVDVSLKQDHARRPNQLEPCSLKAGQFFARRCRQPSRYRLLCADSPSCFLL